MPLPDPTDALRRARHGDRHAVGELWQLHRRFVATVLLAHAGAHELDDLLQEVALRLTRSIHELDDPRRLLPWLRAIARNVAIDHGRRVQAVGHLQLLPPVASDGDDGGHGAGGAEPTFDAPQQQRHREDLEQTLRDLADLDPLYREPLLLRAVDGLSQREIAVALEISETTVETRLARARRWLRERRDGADTEHAPDQDDCGDRRHAPLRRTVD